MGYTSIIAVGIAIGASAFAVYYANDTGEKVKNRLFELKKEVDSLGENFESLRKTLLEKVNEVERQSARQSHANIDSEKISQLTERVTKLESLLNEKLKGFEKTNVQVEYKLESLKKRLDEVEKEVGEVTESLASSQEKLQEGLKESLKQELLAEVEEEIERLEELIERRKDEEVEEFLDLITSAINLQPEKISSGLLEAKKALLSLRDVAKVYVLTGKGKGEFDSLKENLIGLLKNLRKLAVISVPDESVYSRFRDVIILVKRLELPMKDERNEKELNPERSFIEIHRLVYKVAGELDSLAEMINEPVPVTPIEKEFYEKLRVQFEELRKLEKQVEILMAKLGGKEAVNETKEDEKKPSKKELEELLKELGL